MELKDSVLGKLDMSFSIGEDGVIIYKGSLCVSYVDDLRNIIFEEAHSTRYSIHPGATKMYRHLQDIYWWNGLRKDIAVVMSRCPNFQQVKAEQEKLGGLTLFFLEVGRH